MTSENVSELFIAVVEGDIGTAIVQVNALLDQNKTAQYILENHLIPAMNEVGRLFDEGEYFVPDLIISSKVMQESMKILNPLLKSSGVEKIGKVVIGTVQGDMHDIGKNLVASMLEGGGFEVIDLGVNTTVDQFLKTILENEGPIILAMSALLTTTMPYMKTVLDRLETEGLRNRVRIMIGGAPVSKRFANEIGADGYSENANAAVQLARALSLSLQN
ncbi:MAG: corrinoid protein [Planctomycetia bacterium]|nr:corrinoid protein [Planctomycetia bacterium]